MLGIVGWGKVGGKSLCVGGAGFAYMVLVALLDVGYLFNYKDRGRGPSFSSVGSIYRLDALGYCCRGITACRGGTRNLLGIFKDKCGGV